MSVVYTPARAKALVISLRCAPVIGLRVILLKGYLRRAALTLIANSVVDEREALKLRPNEQMYDAGGGSHKFRLTHWQGQVHRLLK